MIICVLHKFQNEIEMESINYHLNLTTPQKMYQSNFDQFFNDFSKTSLRISLQ